MYCRGNACRYISLYHFSFTLFLSLWQASRLLLFLTLERTYFRGFQVLPHAPPGQELSPQAIAKSFLSLDWNPMDSSSSHNLGRNALSSVPLPPASSTSQPIPSSSRQHLAPIPPIVVQYEELDEKTGCSLPSADAVKGLRDGLEGISPHNLHPQSSHPQSLHPDAISSHTRSQQLRVPAPPSLTASPVIPSSWTAPIPSYTRPRGLRITNLLKPWIPIILYALTSLTFLVAISFWKVEVFEGASRPRISISAAPPLS